MRSNRLSYSPKVVTFQSTGRQPVGAHAIARPQELATADSSDLRVSPGGPPGSEPESGTTGRTMRGDITMQNDERDALLFTQSFLQELKDRGWFVGEILGRLEAMDSRLATLEAERLQPSA